MKKFFGKMTVMIALWVVTLISLISMIVVSCRPVSTGWAYKCEDQDVLGIGEEQEIAITFEDEDEFEMFIELEGMTFEMSMWYLRNGDKYAPIGISEMPPLVQDYMGGEIMSSVEFSARVKELKSDRELWRETWANADSISAFKCEFAGVEFVCHTAIATMAISSILFVAGLALAIVSTVVFSQEKIKSAKVQNVNETQTTQPQVNENVENEQQSDSEGQTRLQVLENEYLKLKEELDKTQNDNN